MLARKNSLPAAGLVLAFVLGMQGSAAADLMGYYTFEEVSGRTLVDSSGHGRHAVITDEATKNGPGIVGTSRFGLDAGAGHARVANGTRRFDIAGAKKPFTIAMWFQAPSFGVSQRNHLVQLGQGRGTLFRITTSRDATANENGISDTSGNRITVDNGDRTTRFGSDNTGGGFSSNTWYHLAVTYNGSDTLACYVNGISVASVRGRVAPWTTTPTATDFYICSQPKRGERNFNGIVRDLGIWNEVLSNERIALINGLGRFSGVGLNDASITNVSSVFAAKTGSATAGGQTWVFKATLDSSILGATGGSVAGGNAYVVLDHSGNGVSIVIPEPPTTKLLTPGAGARQVR